jgi:hypothetical protein
MIFPFVGLVLRLPHLLHGKRMLPGDKELAGVGQTARWEVRLGFFVDGFSRCHPEPASRKRKDHLAIPRALVPSDGGGGAGGVLGVLSGRTGGIGGAFQSEKPSAQPVNGTSNEDGGRRFL